MNQFPDESKEISTGDGDEARETPPAAPPLPGGTLRAAREARGLTVFEVAQSLKFSPRQIEAIEIDDFAVLPQGATFVRGFVRTYARLLKLDPVPLLSMLDAQAPAVLPDVRAPQNMGVAATPIVAGRRSSTPMLWGSAVLAVVAVGLAIWHFFAEPATVEKQVDAAPVAVVAEAASLPPPEMKIEVAPAVVATPAPTPSGVAVGADLHQLVFIFQGKSWVEVKDASQRILLSGENLSGTRQVVAGLPPFQLVIGNAAKVELKYEDRQIDLKPYIRAEVARLTIE